MEKEKIAFVGNFHSHTDYSNLRLRDATNKVESLIDRAVELGHSALAITEHETISSALRAQKHHKKIKKTHPNFKLILGNEIYLTRNGLKQENFDRTKDRYYHWILLAKDAKGHEQIRQLSSRAYGRSYVHRGMRRVPTYYQDLYDIIGAEPGHVIATTACLGGVVGTQLMRYRDSGEPEGHLSLIKEWLVEMRDLFGEDHLYLEMQPSHNEDQVYVNHKIIELSHELNIPTTIATDAHYGRKEDREIHKAFLTAQQGDRETDAFYSSTYLMDSEEIYEYMEQYIGEEEIQRAFRSVAKIADMCEEYDLSRKLRIPYLPVAPLETTRNIVQEWATKIPSLLTMYDSDYPSDKHLVAELIHRIEKDEQYQNEETYAEVEVNLHALITSSEANNVPWSAYLLNVKDYVDLMWTKGDSIVGPARGSAGGFLINNILGITQYNPLRENTETFSWRFLNPERVSELDVDIDTERSKRTQIYRAFEEQYGEDHVARIAAFKTEGSRSAIQTAARGLGYTPEDGAYLASLLKSERGATRTLAQTYYGDEEEGIKPNQEFKRLMDTEYQDLWKVASHIEGLVNGISSHAAGIIITDEPFHNSTALMKTRNGDKIIQYDMHGASEVGLIKIDALTVEALDKIRITLDLLIEYGYIEEDATLRETYENTIGIYNLEREDPKMWEMVANHEIQSLFQMEQQSGLHAIELVKPNSVDEIALLSSVMRLMATSRGAEMPLDRYARIKENPQEWEDEMIQRGLTQEEREWLKEKLKMSPGLCVTQESLMSLLQEPRLGGHSLSFADQARKAIGKKDAVAFEEVRREYFQVAKEKNLPHILINYVWELFMQQRNYSFNAAHTLAYALISLQEMNLAYRFPVVFWNTAGLIVDSGGIETEEVEIEEDSDEVIYTDSPVSFYDREEDDEEEEDEEETLKKKKKGPTRSPNYGKVATAIGRYQNNGIKVLPPNINKSGYTFSPDVKNNSINFGLSGITRIGEDLVKNIIENRPYTSIEDFLGKIKLQKPQMVLLIKSGAFDEFGDRVELMKSYIESISDTKKQLNLRNMKLLIESELLPEELDYEKRIWNLDRYLKKVKKDGYYYVDDLAREFFEERLSLDMLELKEDNKFYIRESKWAAIYKASQNKPREYIKKHQAELLESVNQKAMEEVWEKYALGSLAKWEMDSLSYYNEPHELLAANKSYPYKSFAEFPEVPEIDYSFYTKEGRKINMFKIGRIMGTVLDKDKTKQSISLLTTDGVCTVKIYGAFAHYDKQLYVIDPITGKKKVTEKSMFSRGNKVIIAGYRVGEMFIAKKYKKTPFPTVEQIVDIDENGDVTLHNRRTDE